MTDIWDEKPDAELIDVIQNIQGYETTEMDAWLEKLKVEHDLLKEHSGRWLHFVAVDYPKLWGPTSPQKLMELKEKAEKWDHVIAQSSKDFVNVTETLRKLEAVKIYLNNHPVSCVNCYGDLMKILEAEG